MEQSADKKPYRREKREPATMLVQTELREFHKNENSAATMWMLLDPVATWSKHSVN